ncbi:MAG: DUF2726 domain-containing protein [Betaproteobacteria bacterium]|nr:DUF2726 domain-containing protein [Betaproteobacteria bacterium]
MWYVIGLIWIALIAGIIWSYQKKKARHDVERASQFDQILTELKRDRGAATAGTAGGVQSVAAPAAVPDYSKRERLLAQPDALLYYVLRTGLPDHEIFAHLTLADLVEVTPAVRGYERDQKIRRLSQQRFDFVVCTRQFEVVAVMLVNRGAVPDAAQVENARFAEECLQAAGIRLVRIDAAAPPRHHEVRALVYGAET